MTPSTLDLPRGRVRSALDDAAFFPDSDTTPVPSPRGVVRISASEIVGVEVLPAILADLRERHPDIVVELALAAPADDVPRRDADIAIRMIRPTREALVATYLGPVALGLFAHRRYVEARGLPAGLDELAGHAIIGFDRTEETARVMGFLGLALTREAFAIRTHSRLTQLALLRAGFGIGICQWGIARRDGDLVPVLPERVGAVLDLWLAIHEDAYGEERVRLVAAHLAAGLGAYAETSRRA